MTRQPAFDSYRSPVLAVRGLAASSQPLASQAGLEILMRGGNAADAAVAMAAALNVTEPTSTGIGGDCFALFYEARSGKVTHEIPWATQSGQVFSPGERALAAESAGIALEYSPVAGAEIVPRENGVTALNGSGRAPAGLSLAAVERAGQGGGPFMRDPFHALNVTVPGACAGWCDLVARHGSLPLNEVLRPAIRLAEDGFPVAPLTAYFWARGADRQLKTAPGGQALTLNGRAPRAGEMFRNPGLARTFRAVAEGGADAFYQGEIASAIARALQSAGGVMEAADLAAHTSTWDQAISVPYHGLRVWECPPNGQGLAALLALQILDGVDLAGQDPLGAERWHWLIEAMRSAFADAHAYVADPHFAPAPLAGLLSPDYAAQRRAQIDPQRARADYLAGTPAAASGTVYLCVVDGQGNACSFINSNYMGFGTGIVPEGWGFSLQNRGHNFRLDPEHPNALLPGKRPYHTIIPGLLTRADGSLYGPFGVMGGFMQPQGHMQVVVGLVDDGLDPQAALNRLRFCLDPAWEGGRVNLEAGLPPALAEGLAARGHALNPNLVAGYARAVFGRGQIIRREPDGVLWGGSDPRADGCAMGF